MTENNRVNNLGAVPRACAAGVAITLSVLLTGCVSSTDGTAVRSRGAAPQDVAPLDEAQLDGVLLSVDELNTIVDSTRMKVTSELEEMTDHSAEVSDPACLGAVYGGEAPVYEGTGWTAVRDQVAREPDDDNDHWVEQTAVLYPAAGNAQQFFDESSATWQECANAAITVGDGDYRWELEDVEAGDTLITQLTTQEGADGWACQHALSKVSNLTAEVWACGYDITDEAAEIATAMVEKAAAR